MCRTLAAALVAACFALPAPARGGPDREAAADSLHRRALARIASGSIDARRAAVGELDQATHLAPGRADLWRALARACQATGQFTRARDALARVVAITPEDAEARLALGLLWKWDWLTSLEDASLAQAGEHLLLAARLAARDVEPRLAIAAIALTTGDRDLAYRAAWSALGCDREAPEPLLALGSAAYRNGDLARADSAFREALPRLPPEVRRRFADLSAIAAGRDPPATDASPAHADTAAFWRRIDPDLTTRENEVALGFLARVAHAVLLFRDDGALRWDMRAELCVRYGVPRTIRLHPPDSNPEMTYRRLAGSTYAPPPLAYPYGVQVWEYPELGMSVTLWDQALSQSYQLPVAHDRDPDPRPDPRRVAGRPEVVVLGGGRSVHLALPAGVTPMPARARVSRFPADPGARLVASVESPGGPADTLWGSWAVVDSAGRERAGGSGPLSASACDPAERRAANFSADLPPGDYRVHVSVDDRRGRRGVVRLETSVPPAPSGLALGDIVLLCGAPVAAAGAEAVRIEPSFDGRIGSATSVSVYFEADRLAAGADGLSRFAYTYVVRPADPTPRRTGREPVFQASRVEEFVGTRRRQFLSVPVKALARGGYDLEVEIRDLVSGATAAGAVRFVKD